MIAKTPELIVHTMEQRSDEWFAARLGKITGTSFQPAATGRADTKKKLALEKAAEILTGVNANGPRQTEAMLRGIEIEPFARQAYEAERLVHVTEVGFIELSQYVGISPDGLIGDDGGLEIKCPLASTHVSYLTAGGEAWKDYKWQIQGALLVTGRAWWDFVSYHPDFPAEMQLVIERVEPDLEMHETLSNGLAEVQDLIAGYVKAAREVCHV